MIRSTSIKAVNLTYGSISTFFLFQPRIFNQAIAKDGLMV